MMSLMNVGALSDYLETEERDLDRFIEMRERERAKCVLDVCDTARRYYSKRKRTFMLLLLLVVVVGG
jgi:hypothetical protein